MIRYLVAILLSLAVPPLSGVQASESQAIPGSAPHQFSDSTEINDQRLLSAQPAHQEMHAFRPVTQAQSPRSAATEPEGIWHRMAGNVSASLGLRSWLSWLGITDTVAIITGATLLIASVLFAFRWWRREPDYQFPIREPILDDADQAPAQRGQPQSPASSPAASQLRHATVNGHPQPDMPADFNAPDFLNYAKECFKRLQVAWDIGDAGALQELSAPQVFAELNRQLNERKGATGHTEVALLNASLIGMRANGYDWIASVKFSGMIRTSANDIAAPFIEVWNLTRQRQSDHGWTVSGIQQLQ